MTTIYRFKPDFAAYPWLKKFQNPENLWTAGNSVLKPGETLTPEEETELMGLQNGPFVIKKEIDGIEQA